MSSEPDLRPHKADRLLGERIARVLHDDVGQVVSAVGLKLELLRMDLEQQAPEVAERISGIQQLLETAMAPLRTLIAEVAEDSRSEARGQTPE